MTLHPSQPSEDTALLAALLGINLATFVGLLPAEPWRPEGDLPADVLWLAAGDPILVLVGAARGEVVVAVPRITWQGPHRPVLGVTSERRHELGEDLVGWLAAEISTARAIREATFTTCVRCERRLGPESMHVGGLCQSCAVQDGVVF